LNKRMNENDINVLSKTKLVHRTRNNTKKAKLYMLTEPLAARNLWSRSWGRKGVFKMGRTRKKEHLSQQ